MSEPLRKPPPASPSNTRPPAGNARLLWWSLVALGAGLAIGGFAVYRATRPPQPVEPTRGFVLNEMTRKVLNDLRSPVQVRFYSLFNSNSVPAAARAAAERASELLGEVEQQSGGKVALEQVREWSLANTKSAAADGVIPFDLDKGDGIYLGLVLTSGSRRQVIPQISPDWSSALEFDLARALERLNVRETAPVPAVDVARVADAGRTVQELIPDGEKVSLEAGKKLLQEAALKELQAVVKEMNAAVAAAEREVQSAGSDQNSTNAVNRLQEIRKQFTEKLREVSLRAQAQQEAWARLKSQ